MDILTLLTALVFGYICFVSVGLFLVKLLFPFLTKEELKKQRLALRRHKTMISAR